MDAIAGPEFETTDFPARRAVLTIGRMLDDKSVRWRCRRGMKELDVLLERFLDRGYASLDEQERDAFVRLLDQIDPDLLSWLTGREPPANPVLAALIERMLPFIVSSAS
jgi:antitoxin CptB